MNAKDLPALTRRPEMPPLTRTYEVASAERALWRSLVLADVRDQLIDHWAAAAKLPPAFAGGDVPPADLVVPPAETFVWIRELLGGVAEHFCLPFSPSSAAAVLARYAPGAGTDWHVDAAPAKPSSLHRTVSFSVLLNDDFTNGDLVTDPGGVVEMAAGDLCGFTSRTWHRVAPVHSGERFALVAFGGFGR